MDMPSLFKVVSPGMKEINYRLLLIAAVIPMLGYHTTAVFFRDQHPAATNVWLFVVVFLTLGYILGVIANQRSLRWAALITFIYSICVFFMASVIIARWDENQPLLPHDGAMQIEAAAWELREGRNPYAVNYAPSLAAFVDINNLLGEAIHNPVLNHLVYLPFHIILTLAARDLVYPWLGWFDLRLLHWGVFFSVLIVAHFSRPQPEWRQQLWLLLGIFNPLFFPYLLEGRGDALVFALLLLGFLLLSRRSFIPAAVIFGLAFATRQTVWFLFPFLSLYMIGLHRRGEITRLLLKKCALVFTLIFLAIMLPFFLWSPRDFVDDTLLYTIGASTVRYPINGFGLGTQLVTLGLIPSLSSYFPFWAIQLAVIIPLLILLLRWQKCVNTLERMLLAYAVWLFTFWILSRFFHENYLGYITELLLLAWWWSADLDRQVTQPYEPSD